MFQVIVVHIPSLHLPFQIFEGGKDIPFVEFLLILSMRTLHLPILSRFSRINEIVNDALFLTGYIEGMDDSRLLADALS